MNSVNLYIDNNGNGRVPVHWRVDHPIRMQRLYYIRGGIGHYCVDGGQTVPFEPDRIYLFPYNWFTRFESDPDDPIDHIYFDFITTPPIISPTPIIRKVAPGSELDAMLKVIDPVSSRSNRHTLYSTGFGSIADAPAGSRDEQKQLLYHLLLSLLTMLNAEEPLPFISDESICRTLTVIRERYASPLSVGELAAAEGFELNSFIRRFRKQMGVTPYAYLRSVRLLKARELLAGGETYAMAAQATGYGSVSALSRALRGYGQ